MQSKRLVILTVAGALALAAGCGKPGANANAEATSASGSGSGSGTGSGTGSGSGSGSGPGSGSGSGPVPAPGAAPAALFAQPVPPAVSDALAALQKSLGTRLQAAMADGGPVRALEVCHTEAPSLTLAAQVPGIALGRTSHRLRNPKNAPPAWAAEAVAAGAALPPGAAQPQTFALPGGKVGLLRPIPTAPLCVACHGDAAAQPPELKAALAQRYPRDQATGFAAGSLRGWFWAEWTAAPPP